MRKQRKNKLVRLNIFLSVVLVFTFAILNIGANTLDYQISKLNEAIKKQDNRNQSLTMKINELASPENVQLVAQNLGLEYNNNNIRTISE